LAVVPSFSKTDEARNTVKVAGKQFIVRENPRASVPIKQARE
jgi:hypothetical protein